MHQEKTAYEKLGLSTKEVIEIQKWLFPMIAETNSTSTMIQRTVDRFQGVRQHYALYILGNTIGQGIVKEQLGLIHTLNPNEA